MPSKHCLATGDQNLECVLNVRDIPSNNDGLKHRNTRSVRIYLEQCNICPHTRFQIDF
jgi:hypothetical protein